MQTVRRALAAGRSAAHHQMVTRSAPRPPRGRSVTAAHEQCALLLICGGRISFHVSFADFHFADTADAERFGEQAATTHVRTGTTNAREHRTPWALASSRSAALCSVTVWSVGDSVRGWTTSPLCMLKCAHVDDEPAMVLSRVVRPHAQLYRRSLFLLFVAAVLLAWQRGRLLRARLAQEKEALLDL